MYRLVYFKDFPDILYGSIVFCRLGIKWTGHYVYVISDVLVNAP